MPQKKSKGGRPARGTTIRRDAIESIEAEIIALQMDLDELDMRTRQALRRTPVVNDVLGPAVTRLAQMRSSLGYIKTQFDIAWDQEQAAWRSK